VGQAYPPFAFNSITFEPSIVHPEGYIVTPVSTSIQASATAFQKFLDLVNFSGYLDQSEMIPVMSIANIQIRYSESDSGEAGEVVNVSTKINFYSRPQEKNS
jgi:hypothetical protein